ncbi:MAG TPA: M48 family metalloprotease [Oligoflexus sp.]|uniref:M48 family metalloprotease n=1 Tax=Oligoflexus sp. TaxID=1971216 RepID=UPI002D246375|nr:M48 family metalloprotease [Oligoflexus sp.]HYX39707.1 M48 family metalloprotease [Oligoflexus sp.]
MNLRVTWKPLALCLMLSLLNSGCGSPEDSTLDHTLGKTSRERKVPLQACKPSKTSDAKVAYLQTLLTTLMKANPNTFKGDLAPSKFCLTIDQGQEINASGNPVNGDITVNVGLIKAMNTDAEIAGALAHELAHITMAHIGKLENDKVAASPAYKKLSAEAEGFNTKIKQAKAGAYTALRDAYKKDATIPAALRSLKSYPDFKIFLDKIGKNSGSVLSGVDAQVEFFDNFIFIRDSISFDPQDPAKIKANKGWASVVAIVEGTEKAYFANEDGLYYAYDKISKLPRDQIIQDGAGAAQNWKEQEADEVGFELYLRAGFMPQKYLVVHEIIMSQSKTDKACAAMLTKGTLPKRGEASHPDSCWRVYNINKRELITHKEYAAFKGNTKTTVVPGKLKEIKAGL